MTRRDWIDEPAGSEEDMNALVAGHQALLSGDMIVTVFQNLPPALQKTSQGKFLEAVIHYHLQHRITDGTEDWRGAWNMFVTLLRSLSDTASPLLLWYTRNYAFLSSRKMSMDSTALLPEFEALRNAAELMSDPLRQQLLGFVLYNWSRLLLQEGRIHEAAAYYILGGAARVRYWHAVKNCGDDTVVKNAATQVWKIHADWQKGMLPTDGIVFSPVPPALFTEVAALADPTFSAKK